MSTQEPATSEELRDRTDPTRFELYRNGQLVGELTYRHLHPNRYALLHTEVLPDHRRQGVGSALLRAALGEIRARSGTVTAICSFVADYLDGNQEFADVVDPRHPGHPNRMAADEARNWRPSRGLANGSKKIAAGDRPARIGRSVIHRRDCVENPSACRATLTFCRASNKTL